MLIKSCDEIDLQSKLNFCSFTSWYKNYEKITIPSISIPIPEDLLDYFRDELVVLPKECYGSSNNVQEDESEWDDEITENVTPEYPEFSSKIENAIKKLQGSVFLKTNWHCPKDAFWITAGQTLKVRDILDAYQLLKASSIIKNDLNFCYMENQNDNTYSLILREWKDIHPGTEFRCFVRNRKLIAVSPRDWPQFHKHIIQQKHEIINDIISIFKEKIQSEFPLDDFCFDVVRQRKDHVILIDFSPFEEKFTDALAFDWEFLKSEEALIDKDDEDSTPEFRYLSSDCGIQPHRRNNYAIPQDIIDMFSSENSETRSNLTDLLAARVQEEMETQNREDS